MVLENCAFDRVARDHTALVCGLNLDFVTGMASGLDCTDLQVSLEPSPGTVLRQRPPGREVRSSVLTSIETRCLPARRWPTSE